MSVLERIETRQPRMSPADSGIAQLILDDPGRMLRLSSAELAALAGRNQSTVVKFSQKLGFRSYQDLKLAISEARASAWRQGSGGLHGSITQEDPPATILAKLVESKQLTMQRTAAANSEEALLRALGLLETARHIHLVGAGASALVAQDFAWKLQKLGRAALHSGDPHVQLANAATLAPGDLMVALSHSGRSAGTLAAAGLARRRGAPVLAVTGPGPLARMADLVLLAEAEEDRVRSSSITARDAQLTLTDFLFLLLLRRQPDGAGRIDASQQAVAVLKLDGQA